MRIDSLEIHHLAFPLRSPWATARGVIDTVETIYLRAGAGDHSAWVESCPPAMSEYYPEPAAAVIEHLAELAPAVLGVEITTPAELQEALPADAGRNFSRAALDTCWWVLQAVRRDVPLRRLFDGGDAAVAVGAAVSVQSGLEDLLAAVAANAAAPRVKLKIHPGRDLELLQAVRRRFPTLPLQVDCNGAYRRTDLDRLLALEPLRLEMIEQPLPPADLEGHAQLQARLQTPICLDESICSRNDAAAAIETGACRIINLKPGRVGGLGAALEILTLCRHRRIGCWVGSMLESSLGAAVNAELATAPGMTHPHALGSGHLRAQPLPPVEISGGRLVPAADAAGFTRPDPAALAPFRLSSVIRIT